MLQLKKMKKLIFNLQWKISFIIICYAILFCIVSALATELKQGVRYQDELGNDIGYYQNSHALLVGVSTYSEGWPKLPGVLDDIKAVKKGLIKHGFSVKIVLDPNHKKLKEAYDEFINNYGLEPNNRLLFYFAGHGHTMCHASGLEMGYIVPTNAPNPRINKLEFLATALDMQQFEVYARRIQSNHVLFIFDSCFSGTVFSLSRAIPMHISPKTAEPVRQFITSGRANEKVPDKSIFLHQFVAALNGEGDENNDGYITAAELGRFLEKKVENYSRDTQHPQYGKIRDPHLDKGDFVFISEKSVIMSQAILSVMSNVSGARIFVDGQFLGTTNLSDTAIMPGEHMIRVEKKGYEPYSINVQLEKDRPVSLIVNLRLRNAIDDTDLLRYLKRE